MTHPGRSKFIEYICQRGKIGKEKILKELLVHGFESHDMDPPLREELFHELRNHILELVNEKYIEEIVTNMSHSCFVEEMK